jgi:hypothetical protein
MRAELRGSSQESLAQSTLRTYLQEARRKNRISKRNLRYSWIARGNDPRRQERSEEYFIAYGSNRSLVL